MMMKNKASKDDDLDSVSTGANLSGLGDGGGVGAGGVGETTNKKTDELFEGGEDGGDAGFQGFYCQDFLFAFAIVAYIVTMIVFAVATSDSFYPDSSTGSAAGLYLGNSLALAAFAMLPTLIWIFLLYCAPRVFLYTSMILLATICFLNAAFLTIQLKDWNYTYYWWPAVVFSIFGVLVLIYMCLIRDSIAFAAANLKVAIVAISARWFVYLFSFFYSLIMMLLFYIVVVASQGINTKYGLSPSSQSGVWFAAVFGIYWMYETTRNIVLIASANTVMRWWKYPNQVASTLRSFARASTSNLGSAAVGGLFVALIEVLQTLVVSFAGTLAGKTNFCLVCMFTCISCCLSCVEYLVKMFNRFAFVYVGIYQIGFFRAGVRVFSLFKAHGMEAIVNDNLIENVLWLASLITALLTAWIGVLLSQVSEDDVLQNGILGSTGFFLGYIVSQIIFGTVSSASSTVYVCYIEHANYLRKNHPDVFQPLDAAWRARFPSIAQVQQEEKEPLLGNPEP